MEFLPYGKQYIDEEDIKAVNDVLSSGWLTTGLKVREFEDRLAQHIKAKYVVSFSSGTAALHAAYFTAGISEGDEVITSPITFASTANAARFLGGVLVFADVRQDTVNIDVNKIEEHINSRTKAIAPIDFSGLPADLEQIKEIAEKHNLTIIEDAAHALGAEYQGTPIGSISDMTIFSFHPVKHITTGEGGAVATNNEEYYKKLLNFRSHGIAKQQDDLYEYHGPWYYEMQFLGYNYRLSDIQCALGISQLNKLDNFLNRRREIANIYNEKLKDVEEIQLPNITFDRKHAWHLYIVRLNGENPPRKEIFEKLQKRGIGVQVHYIPVYWHPYYRGLDYQKGLCPTAEDYYKRCISLPIFPAMSDEDIERVANEIKSIIREFYN